jgi:hypothetical protein
VFKRGAAPLSFYSPSLPLIPNSPREGEHKGWVSLKKVKKVKFQRFTAPPVLSRRYNSLHKDLKGLRF